MSDEVGYKRLCWHSRRGMLELDLILVPFIENGYLHVDERQQKQYEFLLEQEDTDIFTWFLGSVPAPEGDLAEIVATIKAFNQGR